MKSKLAYGVVLLVVLALLAAAMPLAKAVNVQYQVLSSFDFLSADEVDSFENTTLTGEAWNSWNTTEYGTLEYSVSDGKLNITSTSGTVGAKEGFLVYPRTFNGYAEITLDQGIIGVFENYNGTGVTLTGFEIVKNSNGITVYSVNGSDKTAVASITTTATKVIITVENGKFRVDLGDGTGVYEAGLDQAVLALGAPADGQGIFDKVVLYGRLLSGTYEIDLGSKTVYGGDRIAEFPYDVSKYSNIKSAKLIVKISTTSDPYLRYFIVTANVVPESTFWKNPPDNLEFGLVVRGLTREYDVLSEISSKPSGTFYVGISVYKPYEWAISAKLVIDASEETTSPTTTSPSTTTEIIEKIKTNDAVKYALIGAGAIIFLIVVFSLLGGKRGRHGIAPVIAALLAFLILGGIAAAVLAWFHPEYLVALAFGLGAIAIILFFMFLTSGKTIPNPFNPPKK